MDVAVVIVRRKLVSRERVNFQGGWPHAPPKSYTEAYKPNGIVEPFVSLFLDSCLSDHSLHERIKFTANI